MIRAIGWDHPRCSAPMLAAGEAWQMRTGVQVAWTFRSLDDFNDQPVHELAPDYDLLVIDHPSIPEAVLHGALTPLERLLGRVADEAYGPSARSYRYRGSTWALPVDGACQVSAHNPQILREPPETWPEVLALARRRPQEVAMPLLPADALCALLSVAATLGRPLIGEVPLEAVTVLTELAPHLHPDSWTCAPPQLLTRGFAYIPLAFGYCTLAGKTLRFGDAPTIAGRRAPVLGGAGVAVSAAARDPAATARFAAWLCEADTQRDVVLAGGGQPAHAAVWSSSASPAFFHDTRRSMHDAHVRPADPAWPAFHRDAGADLAAGLRAGDPPERIARRLQQRLAAMVPSA